MTVLRLSACTVDLVSGQVRRTDGTTERLPSRELELLAYLARREGQVVPRDELHERVWQYGPEVVSRAADVAMRRLRQKLEVDPSNPEHLLTQFGAGYAFVGPPPATATEPLPEDEPMVGRVEQIEALTPLLRQGPGIVSLVGPPGAGKTRLARHLAWRLSTELTGGTWFCDLTEATDRDGVVRAVARALGLALSGPTEGALERLGHALLALGPALLVFDNCEQVLQGAGGVAEDLVAAVDGLRVVATSREALGCTGEHVARVEPLEHDAAVELFVTLAQRVRPGFTLDDDQQAAVVDRLVERLERLPLALALAAGRIGALSPQHLLDRLDERFRLLQSRVRDVDPRQRTLLAAVDWSWDLLTDEERAAMAQTAAFHGGFDDHAARAVIEIGSDPVEVLGRLVARSLLERRAARYGAFAFIREYAEKRLGEAPDVERETWLRHATHYAGLGATSVERDNLRAATDRSIALGRGDLAGAAGLGLLEVYRSEGPLDAICVIAEAVLGLQDLQPSDEVRLQLRHVSVQLQTGLQDAEERLADAVAVARQAGDAQLESHVYRLSGHLNRQRGRRDQAEADLTRAVQLARANDDGEELAHSLSSLGILYRELGQYDRARAAFEELLAVLDAHELTDHRSYTYSNLAQLARREGRIPEARELYARSLQAALELGDGFIETTARIGVGNLHLELGELPEARASYERAGTLARRMGLLHMEGQILGNLGIVARAQGDLRGSRGFSQRALEIFEATTNPREAALALGNLGDLDLEEGLLDEAEIKLTRAGRALRAVGDALSEAEVLGPLAELALARGDLERARSHLDASEAEARRQGHPVAIAQALARRGLLELAEGRDARATLAEAASLAPKPSPDLARLLDRLRAAISTGGGLSES